jgi:4-alpha-glucanotransferase
MLFASRSDFLILPVQDVFGWRDRINTPATHGHDNWTWRVPWPVDQLGDVEEARARAATLRAWSVRHNRARAARASRDTP